MLEERRHRMALLMILITILTIALLFKASGKKVVLWVLSGWIILQGAVALTMFYTHTEIIPPRLMLLIAPPLLLIGLIFLTPAGRRFMDDMDGKKLTYLHTVRILVEIMLFELFRWQYVPRKILPRAVLCL